MVGAPLPWHTWVCRYGPWPSLTSTSVLIDTASLQDTFGRRWTTGLCWWLRPGPPPSSSIAAIPRAVAAVSGLTERRARLGLDTADSNGTIEQRGDGTHQPGGIGSSVEIVIYDLAGTGTGTCGLPVPVSRWWRRADRGVLEGILAIALRCCGSREFEISDSDV